MSSELESARAMVVNLEFKLLDSEPMLLDQCWLPWPAANRCFNSAGMVRDRSSLTH